VLYRILFFLKQAKLIPTQRLRFEVLQVVLELRLLEGELAVLLTHRIIRTTGLYMVTVRPILVLLRRINGLV